MSKDIKEEQLENFMKFRENREVSEEMWEGASLVLMNLGNAKRGEQICVISDSETRKVGELFYTIGKTNGLEVKHYCIESLRMHGEEPPTYVAESMLTSNLILGLTTRSMAHSKVRGMASQRGIRYLSLPEYSFELLKHPALRINYKECAKKARDISDRFTSGESIRVVTSAGTDFTIDISGRIGNFCPGYVDDNHLLGSPPDIESNISPIENHSEGVLVVDGSIPIQGLGRLEKPVVLEVKSGVITSIKGHQSHVDFLLKIFDSYDQKARILAEFGIGFNPGAKLCGNMLLDEGCYGTFHCGFGSNSTVGGNNDINFHLDFVYYASECSIDGDRIIIK